MSPTTSNQLVAPEIKIKTIRSFLERSKVQIVMALPRHMTADKMLRVTMTTIQRNPRLLDCTEVSLIGAVIQAAQLGLEPDGLLGHAYLIPRRNNRKGVIECHFQPGYKGLMRLARNSKEVLSFDAREVYAGDDFFFRYGSDPELRHIPKGEEDEAKITHVYALARLRDAPPAFEVMTRGQIDAHRKKYSRAGDGDDSAWATAWPSMAKKTVIIRVCKYLPASVELATAVRLAETDLAGLPQDLGALVPDDVVPAPKGQLAELTEKLAAERERPKPAEAEPPDPEPERPARDDEAEEVREAGEDPARDETPPTVASVTESERSLLISHALGLRTTLKLDEKTWQYLTTHHLGAVSISRADPAALADLVASLEKLAADKGGKRPTPR